MTKIRNLDSLLIDNKTIPLKFSIELKSLINSFPNKGSQQSYIELQKRVEALEDQNNHLLYFVHYLNENFPDLVKNILTSDLTNGDEMKNDVNKNEVHEEAEADSVHPSLKNHLPSPTRREMEIIDLLVKGLCAKEIASQLFISETTVITHKKNLKKKFHVRNTVELIAKALNLTAPDI